MEENIFPLNTQPCDAQLPVQIRTWVITMFFERSVGKTGSTKSRLRAQELGENFKNQHVL